MADFHWRIEFWSTPTSGNPDVWSYTRSPAPHLRQHVIVLHVSNKHFKTVRVFSASVCVPVFVSCVVVVAPLQPQFRRELLLVFAFIYYCENLTGFDVLLPSFALCCSACVVVEFHSSHSFHHLVSSFALCCASCVVVEFHSSHSFTISPRIVVLVFFFVLLAVLL